MKKEDKYDLAEWVINLSKKLGVGEIGLSISEGRSSEISVRNQKIDQLKESISLSLEIDLYVDGRFSTHSTNCLSKEELKQFIDEAISSTRFLNPDKFRKLPDPNLYYKPNGLPLDLKIFDNKFNHINTTDKKNIALAAEQEVYDAKFDSKIISVESNYSDSIYEVLMLNSNGFEGFRRKTSFNTSTSVSIQGDKDARPSDFDYSNHLFFDQLKKEGVGRNALSRVKLKQNQTKIKSGSYPMLVENRIASQLLSPLLGAIQGSSIQQNNSFLIDKINQQIISSKVNLVDNPFIVSGFGSRLYDYEGLALKERNIFSQGLLNTYLIDTYYAGKMNVSPNSGQTTNLMMNLGTKDLISLKNCFPQMIFVTGFNGGNCNSTTGDFSYGIEGYLLDDGQITCSISEMNITGNILQLWNNIAEIGNDPKENSSLLIPSLLFESVVFSGL